MLRKLTVLLAVLVAALAAIPAYYQQDPGKYQAMIRRALGQAPAGPASGEGAGKTRVSRATVERARPAPLGKKVRIEADGRGHFLGRFEFNGRPVTALVDTGATYVAVNRSLARRIGLALTQSDFRYKVSTANGETRAAAATIDNMQIGRIYVENIEAVVLDDEALSDALVGVSFLKRLKRFEVRHGALVLEQ